MTVNTLATPSGFRSSVLVRAGAALSVFLAIMVSAWAAIELTHDYSRIAAVWPANAILLAVLLRSATARWPLYLLAGYAGNVAGNLLTGDLLPVAVSLALCNTLEVAVAAIPIRRFWGPVPDLTKITSLFGFCGCAGILAPMISATVASIALTILKEAPFQETWRIWFVADGLSMVLIVPLLLTANSTSLAAMLKRRTIIRTAIAVGPVLAITTMVFYQNHYPVLFLIFPPLLFATFRLRFEGVAVATFLTGVIAVVATSQGHGPLVLMAQKGMVDQILFMQLLLASLTLTALPIASALTSRRRLEYESHAARASAEKANRAKSDYLTGMSHELRTPLNAVIGFSELLSSEKLGAIGTRKYLEYCENIGESGRHLLAMINEMLDFSKIESGRMDLYEENVKVADILEFVLMLLGDSARRKHIVLTVADDPKVNEIVADERLLRQIVVNLATNAIKFTPEGGRVVIRNNLNSVGEFVLSIEDNGVGISPEEQAQIFEPFHRGQNPHHRTQEGTGLGLPIAERLARLHGGSLQLRSRIGHGTTAIIRLPAERIVSLGSTTGAH